MYVWKKIMVNKLQVVVGIVEFSTDGLIKQGLSIEHIVPS